MARSREQPAGGGRLHQPAGVHDGDRVGQFEQQRQVVRDEQHREPQPVPQLDDLLQDLPLGDYVERGGGLIHDH
jgi:hypothetical protein